MSTEERLNRIEKVLGLAPQYSPTAENIYDLQYKTGYGLMDCKKALQRCDGDMKRSEEYLRNKGNC